MMQIFESLPEEDRRLWQSVFEGERAFIQARMDFLARCTDRVAVMRRALHTSQRGTALRLVFYLTPEERLQLFDDLLGLASVGHSDIGLVREAILSLPREWVIANIEDRAEPLLQAGNEEEYRRLLELYFSLDAEVTLRLAQRARQHANGEIREAGEDFIERLERSSEPA
jgi:hypothetical protein